MNNNITTKSTTATYAVIRLHDNAQVSEITFPRYADCANYGGVCFYDPSTDTFRGDTETNGYLLKRIS
jgi:hypothetical protein